jgi:hypothetical protein
MLTLEEILQKHFGCKKPFYISGKPTPEGSKAYGELIGLLYNIGKLTESESEINDIVESLDYIFDLLGE